MQPYPTHPLEQRATTPQHLAALKLAAWGLDVGPCGLFDRYPAGHPKAGRIRWADGEPVVARFDEKQPLTRHGVKDFSRDLDQIDRWWRMWPHANIGARPGPSMVVFDIDPRNDGDTTWATINTGHTLPATLATRTGSGGLHVWFRLPYAGNLRGQAGAGIDIKHRGGYVIMPGSTHPATGDLYVVETWCPPADLPVVPMHLRRYVYRPEPAPKPVIPVNFRRRADGSHLVDWLLEQHVNRNNCLYWAACVAVQDGYDILADLADAAETIGLETREITATINSARRGANRKEGAA